MRSRCSARTSRRARSSSACPHGQAEKLICHMRGVSVDLLHFQLLYSPIRTYPVSSPPALTLMTFPSCERPWKGFPFPLYLRRRCVLSRRCLLSVPLVAVARHDRWRRGLRTCRADEVIRGRNPLLLLFIPRRAALHADCVEPSVALFARLHEGVTAHRRVIHAVMQAATQQTKLAWRLL